VKYGVEGALSGVRNIRGPEDGSAVAKFVAHFLNVCEKLVSAFIQAYMPTLCDSEFRPIGLRYATLNSGLQAYVTVGHNNY
jgi:hypothetical protein